MKLKYYLRGLGIGIIMTALLMGIATKDKREMSDEEIKARAIELGMVEQRTLADIRDEETDIENTVKETDAPMPTEAPTIKPVVEQTQTQKPVIEPSAEPDKEEGAKVTPQPSQEPEPSKEPQPSQEPEPSEEPQASEQPTTDSKGDTPEETEDTSLPEKKVIIQIIRGDSSATVSKRLEELGIVESADAYDRYLCNNGYDRKLNIGTYEIVMGMTEKEIAKIITRTK